jgi:preprotein translocase subunit SecB
MNDLQFTLIDYLLFKLHFSIIDKIKTTGSLTFQPQIQCGHLINKDNVEVLLNVRIERENLPFIVDVAYKGIFNFNTDVSLVDKIVLEKVIYINCAASLFPSVRETIAEVTRRAGFKPLILPPINFVNLYNQSNFDALK